MAAATVSKPVDQRQPYVSTIAAVEAGTTNAIMLVQNSNSPFVRARRRSGRSANISHLTGITTDKPAPTATRESKRLEVSAAKAVQAVPNALKKIPNATMRRLPNLVIAYPAKGPKTRLDSEYAERMTPINAFSRMKVLFQWCQYGREPGPQPVADRAQREHGQSYGTPCRQRAGMARSGEAHWPRGAKMQNSL
jgi:hypothetical protein